MITFVSPDHCKNNEYVRGRLFPAAKLMYSFTLVMVWRHMLPGLFHKCQTMDQPSLQDKLIAAYQIEEAKRQIAREAINELRIAHKKRLELEKLLNSAPN